MRMEDVDSERRIITILNGKGGKDRLIGVSEDVIKSIRELCKRIHPGEDEGGSSLRWLMGIPTQEIVATGFSENNSGGQEFHMGARTRGQDSMIFAIPMLP